MKRISCHITGQVQGVFFRHFTRINAQNLGLTGTVQNMADGSVFVIAEGEEKTLERFTDLLKKGPPRSRVEEVKTEWSEATGEFSSYEEI